MAVRTPAHLTPPHFIIQMTLLRTHFSKFVAGIANGHAANPLLTIFHRQK